MLNLHGGTTISTATISSNAFIGTLLFHDTTNLIIVSALLFLASVSLLISVAMLMRFFVNLRKSALVFCKQESMPVV